MRTSIVVLALLFVWNYAMAQEIKIDASYKYLYSQQWDNAIHTYNFSRPFLTEKQPLLKHGINTSVLYIFDSSKKMKQGINISYSYFRSSAENLDLNNTLNLHLLNAGYILHFDIVGNLYTDIIISATLSGLLRSVNEEPFVYDEAPSKALGVGGDVNLKLGYRLILGRKHNLSPFISLAYTPYHFSPYSEAVINQTIGLSGRNWTGILSAQVGLTYHLP